MNIEEFEDLVDRCGEVPAEWPEAVRADALAFLAGSAAARAVVTEASSLRAMFGGAVKEPAPANLADRIVTLAGRMDEIQPSFTKESRVHSAQVPRQSSLLKRTGLPKSYLWLAACFAAGLGLGLVRGAAGGWPHVDFSTLFAAVVT
jgi:hypothetical protein